MFYLVTGGSGSGKSLYAENKICRRKKMSGAEKLYYIATMMPYGEETKEKINRHRMMRAGKGFETIECFTDLEMLVKTDDRFSTEASRRGICVLLECMSNLTANELYQANGAKERTAEAVMQGVRLLQERCRELVIVTNEVFSELPPLSREMKVYHQMLGEINCQMAKMAEQVTEVVYGIPVEVKG